MSESTWHCLHFNWSWLLFIWLHRFHATHVESTKLFYIWLTRNDEYPNMYTIVGFWFAATCALKMAHLYGMHSPNLFTVFSPSFGFVIQHSEYCTVYTCRHPDSYMSLHKEMCSQMKPCYGLIYDTKSSEAKYLQLCKMC